MAVKMERAKDKLWIVSQYLNRAPYGSNFVGIEAAASGWFGKSAHELGLGEAALLAGMVQAPSRFRPDRGLERALKRREYVLERMLALGTITREQMEAAKSVRPVVRRAPRPFLHPHFCDWALRQAARGRAELPSEGDLLTTLDADVQALVDNAVRRAAEKGGYSVAAVVMKVDAGAVVALACSDDYFAADAGQVNTALSPRPAGSTLKPFLTALALDLGHATPSQRLEDVPMAFKGYRPANFDASHRGSVTLRDALVLSLNIPFVALLRNVGVERFGANLRDLGFAHMGDSDASFGLGMAIGNVETTLLELVSASATFARGGVFLPPVALRRDAEAPSAGERIYSAGASYLVSDMLSGDERSGAALGHVADVRTSRFAWKTGTSSAYRDAWTVVWNPEYVVGVWCGHKSGGFGDKTLVGARAAAPVAWAISRALYPQDDGPWFVAPEEVVARTVCAETGLPASPHCPHVEAGRALAGRSSVVVCGLHRLDANGDVVVKGADAPATAGRAHAHRLAIVKPEDGARYVLVPGRARQRIVCKVSGNGETTRLWWFVNGRFAGTTEGAQPFSFDVAVGSHAVVCTTESGVFASAAVEVVGDRPPDA